MATESSDSTEVDAVSSDQFDSDDAAGDAVSGVSESEDGVPTPTGSIPPGPASPGGDSDSDDLVDPAELPPLGERMY